MKKTDFTFTTLIQKLLLIIFVFNCIPVSFSQNIPLIPPAILQTFQKLQDRNIINGHNDGQDLNSNIFNAKVLMDNVIPSFLRNSFGTTDELQVFAETMLFTGTNEQCRNHTLEWFYQLVLSPLKKQFPATWALQMVDAWGKFPAGILSGHTAIPGDFYECLQIRGNYTNSVSQQTENFKGKYCSTYLFPTEKLLTELQSGTSKLNGDTMKNIGIMESLDPAQLVANSLGINGVMINYFPFIGTCFPSSCSTDDVKTVFLNLYNTTLGGYLDQTVVDCYTDEKPPFDTGDIVLICLLSVIALVCLIGSLYDILIYRRQGDSKSDTSVAGKIMLAFSVPLNTEKLLNTKAGGDNLGCFHGLRFLSMAWVVAGHNWAMSFYSFSWNLVDMQNLPRGWGIQAILNGTVSVDSFFTMSGVLMAYNLLRELDRNKGRFNYPLMVVHRYLRLTPTYAIIIAMMATIVPYLASGPQWYIIESGSEPCAKYWWKNLLYINNFGDQTKACYGEAWYLANDMQFFLVAPLIVYPLWRWSKVGFGILGAFCIASIVAPAVIQHDKELPPTLIISINNKTYMDDNYIKPWARMGPYLVGIFLGYILYLKSKSPRIFQKLPMWLVLGGWTICTGTALAIVFGVYDFYDVSNEQEAFTSVRSALYAGLHRFAWGAVISWIIFACVNGYGGWVNRFLSWKAFMPLGRLTFCVYISSYHLQQIYHLSTQIHPTHFSNYAYVNIYFAHMVMACLIGYILTITLESPFIQLEKMLMPTRKPSPPKEKLELPTSINNNDTNNNK